MLKNRCRLQSQMHIILRITGEERKSSAQKYTRIPDTNKCERGICCSFVSFL
jgi:hypothetical protein